MSGILGYVVTGQYRQLMGLADARRNIHNYDGDLLLWGDEGTVFPTYEAARTAIRRTARYSARAGYRWHCERFRIRRVRYVTA